MEYYLSKNNKINRTNFKNRYNIKKLKILQQNNIKEIHPFILSNNKENRFLNSNDKIKSLMKNKYLKELTLSKQKKSKEKKTIETYSNKRIFTSKMKLMKYPENPKNYKFLNLKTKINFLDLSHSNSLSKEKKKLYSLSHQKIMNKLIIDNRSESNFEEDNPLNSRNKLIRQTIFGIHNIKIKTQNGTNLVKLKNDKLQIHLSYLINDVNLSDFNISKRTGREFTTKKSSTNLIMSNEYLFEPKSYKEVSCLRKKKDNSDLSDILSNRSNNKKVNIIKKIKLAML